jgi:hypothetical protein
MQHANGACPTGEAFMDTLAPLLLAASAGIIFALGGLHLLCTFCGPRLLPRDADFQARMSEVSPVITRETTMWKCWAGFNASHSLGAILFGAVFGYLALWQGAMFFHSHFLQWLGLLTLASYAFLGKRYWFSIPLRGIVLAPTLDIPALLANCT